MERKFRQRSAHRVYPARVSSNEPWRRCLRQHRITQDATRICQVTNKRRPSGGGKGRIDSRHGRDGQMHGMSERLLLTVLYELRATENTTVRLRSQRPQRKHTRTLASTVTSQFSASCGGIPDNVSPFHVSQEGKFGEVNLTGMFAREA